MAGDSQKLTLKQENTIIALLSHPGIENAAKAAGVGARDANALAEGPGL